MFNITRKLLLSLIVGISALTLVCFSLGTALAEEQVEEEKWIGIDVNAHAHLGISVDIDGNTAMLGARSASHPIGDPPKELNIGAAYAYVRYGTWAQQSKIIANDPQAGSMFGQSVSLNGELVLIGSPTNHVDEISSSGSAYLFRRLGDDWFQLSKITASDAEAYDRFGWAVSMDGSYAVIGTTRGMGTDKKGVAYVFALSGDYLVERAVLTASDGQWGDLFGMSVSIDDDTIAVGAQDAYTNGINTGAVYVFVRDGDDWIQEAKLLPSDIENAQSFGSSVSVSGDSILIGDRHGISNISQYAGSAYVFVRSMGGWTEQAKLYVNENTNNFGLVVNLDDDTAIIGTILGNAAYVFARNGDNWIEQTKLVPSDGTDDSYFGESVSVDDGNALVGAHGDNDDRGAAYLFALESAERVSCVGFDKPLDNYPVTLKGKRPLPLKAELFDSYGDPVTDDDLVAPPFAQVFIEPGEGGEAVDITNDLLPTAPSNEGNQFVFTSAGVWQYVLRTTTYSASGTYSVIMESGDPDEYVFDQTCLTQFIVQ